MLTVVILTTAFSMCFSAGATRANVTKKEHTYDIAVVFDNSGSMYEKGEKAWSRAQYAMEIFASMLNYENGDKLTIYPMWKVAVDGTSTTPENFTFEDNLNVEPIVIESDKDIELIANMFTYNAHETPFQPVREAHTYLKKSKATDKWLIVLTDGKFYYDSRSEAKKGGQQFNDAQEELNKLASGDIMIQYLGIGAAEEIDDSQNPNLFSLYSSDTSLEKDLSTICNSIFKRSVLDTSKYLNGKQLKLDLSMNSLIVFAQGNGVSITSLKDEDGNEIAPVMDSGVRQFRTKGCGNYPFVYDDSLYGQVVSFGACEKGTYTLEYSSAKDIQIFYEPDVDIVVTLTNSDGKVIYDSSKVTDDDIEITAGDYKFNYKVIDNRDKNKENPKDISKSPLLGNLDLSAEIIPSQGEPMKVENGAKISFAEDEETYIKVSGTYLEDYTITTDDNKAAFSFKVKLPEVADLKMNVEGADNWYTIKDHEKWQPIKVGLTVNGAPLTAEQMDSLNFAVTPSKETLALKVEQLKDQSAYMVYIAKDENGVFVQPETGVYTLDFSAELPADGFGQVPKASDKKMFEIQKYAEYWRWLIYVIVFGVLIALFCIFMSQKVLPKKLNKENMSFFMMGREIGGGTLRYDRKGRKLEIKSDAVPNKFDAECRASFSLVPVDRRWTASKNRQIGIVGITSSTLGVNKIVVDGVIFTKKDGKFVPKSSPDEPIDEKTNAPNIKIETRYSYLDCTTTQA